MENLCGTGWGRAEEWVENQGEGCRAAGVVVEPG